MYFFMVKHHVAEMFSKLFYKLYGIVEVEFNIYSIMIIDVITLYKRSRNSLITFMALIHELSRRSTDML